MDGVFLFYSPAASQSRRTQRTSSAAAPSESQAVQQPSVIVVTQPLRSFVGPASSPQLSSNSVCDVDLLKLLYLAFPSTFFVLVSPSARLPEAEIGAASDFNSPAAFGSSILYEAWRRAHDKVTAFFESASVQQRTCRLTLGSIGLNSSDDGVAQGRHSLQLNPAAAAHIMLQHPWLQDLLESPHTLRYAAQVAAALLLHNTSSITFYLSSAATLELVTQCEWMGDTQTAAAVLTCVTRAIRARAGDARLNATAGLTAMAWAQQSEPPQMPTWICSRVCNLNDEAGAETATPPAALPLLSIHTNTSSNNNGEDMELNIEEAYCTHTSETSNDPNTVRAPPVNALGGSIGMLSVPAAVAANGDSNKKDLWFEETVHVLVCTALGGAASEREEDAVRLLPSCFLPSLLQFLHDVIASPVPNSESEAITRLQLYFTVNGRDVMAASSYDDQHMQQQHEVSRGVSAPLTGSRIEEVNARLNLALVDRLSVEGKYEEMTEEDEDTMAHMFDQCEATLRQVQQEAHRQQLMWVRHQASKTTQQQNNRSSSEAPSSTTQAAIVICTDEYHLAQWAESGHFLVSIANSSTNHNEVNASDANALLPSSRWALYAGVPIYICLIPSSAVLPSRLPARLCDVPSVMRGVLAARQLCTRTHGFFFISDDHDQLKSDEQNGGGEGTTTKEGHAANVVRSCDAVMAAVVAHLHAWVAAVYRNVHWCVFSGAPIEKVDSSRAKWSTESDHHRNRNSGNGGGGTASTHASTPDSLPHCEVCFPGVAAKVYNGAEHVRLWRCTQTLLSTATPVAPFLAYEATPASKSSNDNKNPHGKKNSGGLSASTTPQPWIEELGTQYAFAFAHAHRGGGALCAVSRVVRVQPRLVLLKPGPLLQWYSRQFQLHHASIILAAVLEAEVEQVKSMFFVLAATEGVRDVRRGVISAREHEEQATAMMKALQRLTTYAIRMKEKEQALLNTFRYLFSFESLDSCRTVALPSSLAASPLYTSQRDTVLQPSSLLDVVAEVEAARRTQLHEQQKEEYQLGGPLAPSLVDLSAAVMRLLSLVFLRARTMEVHARYAASNGDYMMQRTTEVLAGRKKMNASDVKTPLEATKAEAVRLKTPIVGHVNSEKAALKQSFDASRFCKGALGSVQSTPVAAVATPDSVDTKNSSSPQQMLSRVNCDVKCVVDYNSGEGASVFPKAEDVNNAAEQQNGQGAAKADEEAIRAYNVILPLSEQPAEHYTPSFTHEGNCNPYDPASLYRSSSALLSEPNVYESAFIRLCDRDDNAGNQPQQQAQQIVVQPHPFDVRLPSPRMVSEQSRTIDAYYVQSPISLSHTSDVSIIDARVATTHPEVQPPTSKVVRNTDSTNAITAEDVGYAEDTVSWFHLPGEERREEAQASTGMKTSKTAEAVTKDTDSVTHDALQQASKLPVAQRVEGHAVHANVPVPHFGAFVPNSSLQQHLRWPPLSVSVNNTREDKSTAEKRKEPNANRSIEEAVTYMELPTAMTPPPPSGPPIEAKRGVSSSAARETTLKEESSKPFSRENEDETQEILRKAEEDAVTATIKSVTTTSVPPPASELLPVAPQAHIEKHKTDVDAQEVVAETNTPSNESSHEASVAVPSVSCCDSTRDSLDSPTSTCAFSERSEGVEDELNEVVAKKTVQKTDEIAAADLSAHARQPTGPPPCDRTSAPDKESGGTPRQFPLASQKDPLSREAAHFPLPPRDMRWCAIPTSANVKSENAKSTSLNTLLTSRLPPAVRSRTTAIHVTRFADGLLTVDVLDPTTACVAARCADPTQQQNLQEPQGPQRKRQPAAHLVLFVIDTATGALRFLEAQSCAIAPGADRLTINSPHKQLLDSLTNLSARSSYTFQTRLSPGDAVAVVYVGVRHPLQNGVTPADVLWLSGVAFSVEAPSLRQVRVTSVQAHAIVLEWHAASTCPRTAVKVLVTELATPPPGALAAVEQQPHHDTAPNAHEAASAAATPTAQNPRSVVHVGRASPITINGLHSASIYHVQLVPVPAARQAVVMKQPSSSQQQQQLLDFVVDANVSACAVLAATSVAPKLDFMRVRHIMVAKSVAPGNVSVTRKLKMADPTAGLTKLYDVAYPHITGHVESPLLHYRTSVFPVSLLRNFSFFGQAPGVTNNMHPTEKYKDEKNARSGLGSASLAAAGTAPQLIRLHFTLVPIFSKDTDGASVVANFAAKHDGKNDDFHITSDNIAGNLVGTSAGSIDRWRRGGISCSSTCSHVFRMRAGEEVGVMLSLGVQLDAELLAPPSSKPHYVAVFDTLQRRVLRAILGPFNVCGDRVDVREVSPSAIELAWEGTCPAFHVVVARAQTAVYALEKPPLVYKTEADSKSLTVVHGNDVAPGDNKEQVYKVNGLPVEMADAAPPLPTRTRYCAALRLFALYPASEYNVKVRCAANHVGNVLQCTWHTRPPPPQPSSEAFSAMFDSATRQLRLRFVQRRAAASELPLAAPMAIYQLVVEPLGTTIRVPFVAVVDEADTLAGGGIGCSSVERVVDCSVVARGTPITMYLCHCVNWQLAAVAEESEKSSTARSTVVAHQARTAVAATTRTRSEKVTYCVVSDVHAEAVHAKDFTDGAVSAAQPSASPVVQLTWTCSSGFGNQKPVAYVVLNEFYRVSVSDKGLDRLQLTAAQLNEAGAAATAFTQEKRDAGVTYQEVCSSNEAESSSETTLHSWRGVVRVTGFESPTLAAQEGEGAPCLHLTKCCYLVSDRCQTVILPPPPYLPLSTISLQNYQDEAIVDVDVNAVYCLYYETLFGVKERERSSRTPTHDPQLLADILRQRTRLALEVRKENTIHNSREEAAVQHYPLSLPASHPPQQNQQQRQRIHIPLPSYRPYDGQLHFSLHVSIPDASLNPTSVAAANPTATGPTYTFFIPVPSLPSVTAVPIPPAEPVLDITVSAITAQDAVVDWTPPLSLIRHLRQQPGMQVAYEVRLYPAAKVVAPQRSSPLCIPAPSRVWVSTEPHLILKALEPATPYVVQVRGTGFGDYYATVKFITAPVVADAVVAQLLGSLTVEAVVSNHGVCMQEAGKLRSGMQSRISNGEDGIDRGLSASITTERRGGLCKKPALWAVLPASTVVKWTLRENSNFDSCYPTQGAVTATTAAAAEGVKNDDATRVEVVTHYTVSLIAANGELLRQWTSSPDTTTTLYHEWDDGIDDDGCDASGARPAWPHLEVMSQTQATVTAVGCPPSPPCRIPSDLRHTMRPCPSFPTPLIAPHASQSGLYHRTRLDLIGMPRLVEPQADEACAVVWEGSSAAGYCVSWCLSTDCNEVRHTTLSAASAPPYRWSLTSAHVTEALVKHRTADCTKRGDDAENSEGPVFVLMCVSTRSTEPRRAKQQNERKLQNLAAAAPSNAPHHGSFLIGISDGGSNVLCAAWLLPSQLTQTVQAKVTVMYQTFEKTTLLLPPNYPTSKTETAIECEAALTKATSKSLSNLTHAYSSLLRRKWSIVPPTGSSDATSSRSRLFVLPWAAEQYVSIGLAVSNDQRNPSLLNSMSLVDVQTTSPLTSLYPSPGNTMVGLRCVDTVADKQASVWQRLVGHLMGRHTRKFSAAPDFSESSTVLPSLRWLRSLVETYCELRIGAVCLLEQLQLSLIEEAGVVNTPPLVSAIRDYLASSAEISAEGSKNDQEAEIIATSTHRRNRYGSWFPLRTADMPERETKTTANVDEKPRCRLTLFVGEGLDGEEDGGNYAPGFPQALLNENTATSATKATLAELEALRVWSQRGHPTLRARFMWVSNDDEFVLRVAGPYEDYCQPTETLKGDAAPLPDFQQVDDSAATVNPAMTRNLSSSFPLHRSLHSLLNPSVFPSVQGMPHQRTYTCVPATAQGNEPTELVASGAYLSLQPDGKVTPVVADDSCEAAPTAISHNVEAAQMCTRYEVDVDGLLPEAFYRVQVTGRRSGSTVLRMQFITPPSGLTQVVTVGEAPLDKAARQTEDVRLQLSPAQQVSLHARVYNPHAYKAMLSIVPEKTRLPQPNSLAPGLLYVSYAALEVWAADSGRCLLDHRTYSSAGAKESQPAEAEKEGVPPVTESVCAANVEEAVRVFAVRHLDVVPAVPSAEESKTFLNTRIWGPVITASSIPSSAAPNGNEMTLGCLSGQFRVHVRLPLCYIPQLPRMDSLTVQRRTPHSMQLSWRWWPVQIRQQGNSPSSGKVPSTLLCVRCCRVNNPGAVSNEAKCKDSGLTDGCTVIVPATANPVATLAPLQPGALYEVSIREILHRHAARARAMPTGVSSLSSLVALSSSLQPRERDADLYAVRVLPLPRAVTTAVRALACVSARPASLLLQVRSRPPDNTSSSWSSLTNVQVPRGMVLCYALTPPLPLTCPLPLTDGVRRRPQSMTHLLPFSYSQTELNNKSTWDTTQCTMRVLSYIAAVVIPENVMYIPKDAAAAIQAWWADTHPVDPQKASAEGEMWTWWTERVRSTIERDWLTQATATTERRCLHGRSNLTEKAVQEHWNSELGRCLTRQRSIEEREKKGDGEIEGYSWCLRVKVMEVQKPSKVRNQKDADSPSLLRFVVPVKEPLASLPTALSLTEERTERATPEAASRTVYFLRCTEALPMSCASHCGVVGGAQQLTVCHTPLAVKRIQLVRDVSVRGTTAAIATGDASSTELRVQWRWPAWVHSAFGSSSAFTATGKENCGAEGTKPLAKPQPPCTARLTCTPLPAAHGKKEQEGKTASPAGSAAADAVFMQHIEGRQREVNIKGLKPSTLYRLVFDHVSFGKVGATISCEEKTVIALTPPVPPEQSTLPRLHYTVLPSASSSDVNSSAATAAAADVCTGIHQYCPSLSPAGLEVRFDLPAAQHTPQGLLLCLCTLLVNLDAVDIAACRTTEDLLAAAQIERVAPHVRDGPTQGTRKVLKETAEREAPVVYYNLSTQHRLRTFVTLRHPLQQRYAFVFFNAVFFGRSRQQNKPTKKENEGGLKPPQKTTNDADAVFSAVKEIMYSTPVVKKLQYLPSVRAAHSALTPNSPSAILNVQSAGANQSWRRLLCRPTRLFVQQRTPEFLTLRWQLDLSVARLSDMERLKLLRHGVFTVRIIADSDLVSYVRNAATSDVFDGSCTLRKQSTTNAATAAAGSRTVFYRANMPSLAPPTSPPKSLTSTPLQIYGNTSCINEQKHVEATASRTEMLHVSVCDYLATVDDSSEEQRGEEVKTGTAVAAARRASELSNTFTGPVFAVASDDKESDRPESFTEPNTPNACLTYELNYPCQSYAAAHSGYTVEVSLSPDWNRAETARDESSTRPSSSPVPAEYTSLTIVIPPVLLPLPLQRVSVTHMTQTSCTVQWAVAEGERPAAYCVQYTKHEVRCDCGKPNCVLEPEERNRVWVRNAQQTSMQLINLHHHTSYTICVVPCNDYDEPCEANNATVTVHTY